MLANHFPVNGRLYILFSMLCSLKQTMKLTCSVSHREAMRRQVDDALTTAMHNFDAGPLAGQPDFSCLAVCRSCNCPPLGAPDQLRVRL